MPDVDQLNDQSDIFAGVQILVDQNGPLILFVFGHIGKTVSWKIHKKDFFIEIVVVDQSGFSGR
ncbi:hypothetical protein SDC9_136211 [bioreactor metagenome]|uniref:Uncharacterized protein n=1 Tax=bioreactor metagenome TaxID=1076179 RepID=A0A645DJV1_9ZZZZ